MTGWRLGYYAGVTWDKWDEYIADGVRGHGSEDECWVWTDVLQLGNNDPLSNDTCVRAVPENVVWAVVPDTRPAPRSSTTQSSRALVVIGGALR